MFANCYDSMAVIPKYPVSAEQLKNLNVSPSELLSSVWSLWKHSYQNYLVGFSSYMDFRDFKGCLIIYFRSFLIASPAYWSVARKPRRERRNPKDIIFILVVLFVLDKKEVGLSSRFFFEIIHHLIIPNKDEPTVQ